MPLVPDVRVRIVDSAGALVDSATNLVTVDIVPANGNSVLTVMAPGAAGIADFPGLVVNRADSAGFDVVATSPGLTAAHLHLTVLHGPVGDIEIDVPWMAATDFPVKPYVTVQAYDTLGNPLATAGPAVTLTVEGENGATIHASLAGRITQPLVGGKATFDSLIIRDSVAETIVLHGQAAGMRTGVGIMILVPAVPSVPQREDGGHAFVQLGGAGAGHRCGLTSDGTAWCWGQNNLGQLGTGSTSSSSAPAAVSGGLTFLEIRQVRTMSCGLTTDHRTWCWGGISGPAPQTTPRLVDSTSAFTTIEMANSEVCGLTPSRTISCGTVQSNGAGAAWSMTFANPFADTTLRFQAINPGLTRMCAVDVGGDVHCASGFSTGDSYQITMPDPETHDRHFVSVTGDDYHTCGLTGAGEAYCWGWADGDDFIPQTAGELGDSTLDNHFTPVLAGGTRSFTMLSASYGDTCGITSSGDAVCWGTNEYGQLGVSAAPDGVLEAGRLYYLGPRPVLPPGPFRKIYTGFAHTCALTATATWCWGNIPSWNLDALVVHTRAARALLLNAKASRARIPAASQMAPARNPARTSLK